MRYVSHTFSRRLVTHGVRSLILIKLKGENSDAEEYIQ